MVDESLPESDSTQYVICQGEQHLAQIHFRPRLSQNRGYHHLTSSSRTGRNALTRFGLSNFGFSERAKRSLTSTIGLYLGITAAVNHLHVGRKFVILGQRSACLSISSNSDTQIFLEHLKERYCAARSWGRLAKTWSWVLRMSWASLDEEMTTVGTWPSLR